MTDHRRFRIRDYVEHYRRNWEESTAPLPEKLAKAVKNRAIATFVKGGCCGNLGEPGC
jgi:hypothetical protein